MTPHQETAFLEALKNAVSYSHPAEALKIIETHISWIILAGAFAYKIKKPKNFGFLDFSTLDKRKFFCEEEVRINQRLCPDIYLGVIAITGEPQHPVIGGSGKPFEYAVLMKRFDENLLWDQLLTQHELDASHIDRLAVKVADFHLKVPCASIETAFGLPKTWDASIKQTKLQIQPLITKRDDQLLYDELNDWMQRKFEAASQRMIKRRATGFVREVHGDLHLKNIALLSKAHPEILIFDAIEFDPNLRWIDVINDIAFLFMDLKHHGRSDFAWRFLNTYLEITGDYEGLELLALYAADHALVRAKVSAIRTDKNENKHVLQTESIQFLKSAASYAHTARPCLYITHGLSGSGKTTMTQQLIEKLGAIRLRSDIERKRLFGLSAHMSSSQELKKSMYSAEANEQTYTHLKQLTTLLIKSDFPVIVDAAFLTRMARDEFRFLAAELEVDFKIIDVQVAETILQQRIEKRMQEHRDASEADLQVLAQQIKTQEELTEIEKLSVIRDERFLKLDVTQPKSVTDHRD